MLDVDPIPQTETPPIQNHFLHPLFCSPDNPNGDLRFDPDPIPVLFPISFNHEQPDPADQEALSRLKAWGEINTPELEVSTHLLTALTTAINLVHNVTTYHGSADEYSKIQKRLIQKIRDAVLSDQSKNSYNILSPFLFAQAAEETQTPIRERGRFLFTPAKVAQSTLHDMGFNVSAPFGDEIKIVLGSAMMAYLQFQQQEGVGESASQLIAEVYRTLGENRYTDPSVIRIAMDKVVQAIDPIKSKYISEINHSLNSFEKH